MVHKCIYCGMQWNAKNQRTFHTFPLTNSKKLEKWLSQIDVPLDKIKTSSRLCSNHFQQNCFKEGKNYKILKDDAVPTVFGDRKSSCAYCKGKRNHGAKRSLYKFPFGKPEILKSWIANIPKPNFEPTETSVLCSEHFEKHCFKNNGSLKEKSIPTVFKQSDVQGKSTELDLKEPFIKHRKSNENFQHTNVIVTNPTTRVTEQSTYSKSAVSKSTQTYDARDNAVSINNNWDEEKNNSMYVVNGNLGKTESPQKCDAHQENNSTPVTPTTLARRKRNINLDHCYDYSPRTRKKKLWEARSQLSEMRRKFKVLKQRVKRLSKQVSSLKDIATDKRIMKTPL